jgi:tetratricopeptide (TPR) repeat protein
MALEAMGFCYFSCDRLADALRWYERAIAEAPDGVELGTCLDIVAVCYSSLGKYAEALP